MPPKNDLNDPEYLAYIALASLMTDQERRRAYYRLTHPKYTNLPGLVLENDMTDDEVDMAIALEEENAAKLASQPIFRQGRSAGEEAFLQNIGALYTPELRYLALNLARMNNAYFLGGMSAPYISDAEALEDPGRVFNVTKTNAAALPMAMQEGALLGIGAGAAGAVAGGALRGLTLSGKFATRAKNAARFAYDAAKSINPRVLALETAATVPLYANANDGSDFFKSVGLWGLGTAAGTATLYGLGKVAKAVGKGVSKFLDKHPNFFWNHSPEYIGKRAFDREIRSLYEEAKSEQNSRDKIAKLKQKFGYSDDVNARNYLSDLELKELILDKDYWYPKFPEETQSSQLNRMFINYGTRVPAGIGALGILGWALTRDSNPLNLDEEDFPDTPATRVDEPELRTSEETKTETKRDTVTTLQSSGPKFIKLSQEEVDSLAALRAISRNAN